MDGLRRRLWVNLYNHARDSHMLLEASILRHHAGTTRPAAQGSGKAAATSATGLPMSGVQRQLVNLGRQAGCWGGGGARAETEASGGTRLWQIGHAFLSGAHEERAQRCCVAVGV